MRVNRPNSQYVQGMRCLSDVGNRSASFRVGGFHPFTLSDFPGKVAAIVFTQGCNFRCPFCHNGDLIPVKASGRKLISQDGILSFLSSRRGRVNGVVITGGEPTLQEGLVDFISHVKSFQLAVKLDTNGSRPEVIEKLIEKGLVDFIAMDIKAPWAKYHRLTGIKPDLRKIEKSISIIGNSGIDHMFRTTYVSALLSQDDLESIKKMVPPGSPHRIQRFVAKHALDPGLRAA